MKQAFKKIFIVLFTVVVILVGTAPISSAESKYLIVVNSKKNTLNYYVNYTLVRSFRCSTGKLSTPTPQCKTTIVNKIKNRPYYQTHIPGEHQIILWEKKMDGAKYQRNLWNYLRYTWK